MFRNHTVFILGAGASYEVGLPLGEKLTELIAEKLGFEEDTIGELRGGDPLIRQCLIRRAHEDRVDISKRPYFHACKIIHNGVLFSKSIDSFLYTHANNKKVQFCGKLAIAQIILEHEAGSKLYFDESNIFNSLEVSKLKPTWFRELFSLLQRNRPKGQEEQIFDGIGIINFNYDRCVEHFLFNAIRSYYNIDHERAKAVLSRLKMLHPYGTIGGLLWQGNGFAYGSKPNFHQLPFSAQNIRTYNDEVSDQTIRDLNEMLTDIKTVIFLGFGFHQQNIDLLRKCSLRASRIFATVLNRSEDDKKVIEDKLREFLTEQSRYQAAPVRLLDKDCATAFRDQGLFWSQDM